MDYTKLKLEGAQRACTPRETLDRMRPFWGKAGITRVGEITGLDRIGIPVAQCIRPDAKVLSVDSGKGATPEAALCSAMMEGFERHVGESPTFETMTAPGSKLRHAETRFPLIYGSFYNSHVPREWTAAMGIFSKRGSIVPTACAAMLPAQSVSPIFHACFVSNSNGLSSGNTLEEAIVGGLYEVIERDQIAIHSHKSIFGKRVDLDSIKDETLGFLVQTLRSKDVMPVLFDCTLDLGVPTFVAYIYDVERGTGIYRGYAAHLDPAVAQARAICEAVQSRLVYMSGSRDDITDKAFRANKESDNEDIIADLLSVKDTVPSDYREDRSGKTFMDDINTIGDLLCSAGIPEPLVKVYEHDYPCSVVKVMIPTLEGYYTKFSKAGERALK